MTDSSKYELVEEQFVQELNSNVQLYKHKKSGALIMSIHNDDENKSFGITFRTPPTDSTGVPHIMEHAVLGGSNKYRVKEPFVELVKGSFKTFLNAMTMADMTTYPVASTNEKDFYNLVDVYLDAVFHPLIEPHHLEQEGWHYEIESPDDPLVYKGVVFNEMKGAFSNPNQVLYSVTQEALFPDNAYHHDSGGHPNHIPDLTYEQFRSFHETFYHPSNAFIFFYGDDNPATRLELLDRYLSHFDEQTVDSRVELQRPFAKPRTQKAVYSVEADSDYEQKAMAMVNWALPEQPDPEMWMALSVLSYALMGTQGSPLRKALIDSGLGEDTIGGGFYQQMRQPLFSAGLRGIRAEDAQKVERLVLDTLTTVAESGFDEDLIEAALNTIEFSLRENNTGSFPRGLGLMFRALSSWAYDHHPIEPLKYEGPITAVKEKLTSDSDYLVNLIQKFLLQNNHRVTIILEPDPSLLQKEEKAEQAKLAAIKAKLSPHDVDALIKRTKELKTIQSAPDDPAELAKIPRLSLEDLDQKIKTIPTEIHQTGRVEILHHDLFTNGIVYLEIGFDIHNLPQDLLPYVKLFSRSLTDIGLESEDYVKLSQRIGRKTGGIHASTSINNKLKEEEAAVYLMLDGKATMAQSADMLAIMRDILLTVKLDNQDRFRQMVLKAKAQLESGLVPSGHSVVNTRLNSYFSEGGWVSEQLGGVSYLFFLRQLAKDVDENWPNVLSKLESIRQILISQSGMIANVTLDAENFREFLPQLKAFINEMPDSSTQTQVWQWRQTAVSEGLTIPAQVNYVSKGTDLYAFGYAYHGSNDVIRKYLGTTWIWEKIRVMGGAYGGFATFSRHSGVWSYLSYRDPNLLETIANYDGTAEFLRRGISEGELVKSIIGAVSNMDSYQLPDAKGYSALIRHLTGVTDEVRQQIRDEVLNTTSADFVALADYLDLVRDNGLVVVLGASEAIASANEAKGGDWLEIRKVM